MKSNNDIRLQKLQAHTEAIKQMPLEEQLARDVDVFKNALTTAPSDKQTQASQNVLKKLFITASDSKLDIVSNDEKNESKLSPDKQNMPLASVFAHGGRVMFTFDQNEQGKQDQATFREWRTEGAEVKSRISSHSTVTPTASPLLKRTDSPVASPIIERKGLIQALRSTFRKDERDLGTNLAIPPSFSSENNEAKGVTADGSHGHLLMNENKSDIPRTMIGIENSEMGKTGTYAATKHDARNVTNELSATGGLKFESLSKQEGAEKYNMPEKYGEMRVHLSHDDVERITSKTAEKDFHIDMLKEPIKTKAPEQEKELDISKGGRVSEKSQSQPSLLTREKGRETDKIPAQEVAKKEPELKSRMADVKKEVVRSNSTPNLPTPRAIDPSKPDGRGH